VRGGPIEVEIDVLFERAIATDGMSAIMAISSEAKSAKLKFNGARLAEPRCELCPLNFALRGGGWLCSTN
jgi:hypothetical protein